MLRLVIGTGFLLMTVGFGAAGWQYWQSLPPSQSADPVVAVEAAQGPASQSWLISPTGGLVPPEEVRAYLAQDRYAKGRSLFLQREANLSDLLSDGEILPEPAFLQVLADIRAPKLAEGPCAVLIETIARDCAVHSARVVEGSVDLVQGTAQFRLELAYSLKEDSTELPDLAAHVLRSQTVQLDLEAGTEGTGSPEAALRLLLATVDEACAAEAVGEVCRAMQLSLDWRPDLPVTAQAGIAWLEPLPEGMFVTPPLDAVSGG